MHVVDRIFQHHLRGKRHGYERARSGEPMALAVLAEQVRELDDWYVVYVGALPEDRIDEEVDFAFTNGPRRECGAATCFCMWRCMAPIIAATPASCCRRTA